MFEKEAEEYRKDLKSNFFLSEPQLDCACQGFKDGAEFGYNKCFEQIQKIVNEDTRLDCIIPELLRLQEKE